MRRKKERSKQGHVHVQWKMFLNDYAIIVVRALRVALVMMLTAHCSISTAESAGGGPELFCYNWTDIGMHCHSN